MFRCLGVYREVSNSPNRETDDALILRAVLEQLESLGVQTRVVTPEELDPAQCRDFDVVLPMCEAYPRIKALATEAARGGRTLWVNPPQSVLNCYRQAMIPALKLCPGVRFPDSELRSVADGPGKPPAYAAPEGWWVKRGDVHNMTDHDVIRARAWSGVTGILRDFAQREIVSWVVQPHIDGDLVKFYGVGPGHWFTWFYHDPVRARRPPYRLDDLAEQARRGAGALGLEVFGGDAIISSGGVVTLLDLNSWPSFALVRREAAVQISWHMQNRLAARQGAPSSGQRRLPPAEGAARDAAPRSGSALAERAAAQKTSAKSKKERTRS